MSKMVDVAITTQELLQTVATAPHAVAVYALEEALRTVKAARTCGECEEYRPEDERVIAGMKCFNCTYVLS